MRYGILASGILLAAVLLASQPAAAQQDTADSASILQKALGATGDKDVFRIEKDQAVHVQSGLACPAQLGNATLFQLMAFDSPAGKGMDIGCDYGRMASPDSNAMAAKHTIFAVKLPAGWTLDEAFKHYRKEMHDTAPANARSGGESLHMQDPPQGFPAFRSEELFYQDGRGKQMQTEVIVTVIAGWIIEVRSTRASQYALETTEEGADQPAGVMLFFNAIGALGGPDFNPAFEIVPAEPDAPQLPKPDGI